MFAPGGTRRRIAHTLGAAYSGGLLSDDTFAARLDQLMQSRVVDPRRLIGDLSFRGPRTGSLKASLRRLAMMLANAIKAPDEPARCALLGLDWTGLQPELVIGRHDSCDVVLNDLSVSRRHARLVFRDHKWIIHDLRSTNGTIINGVRVGRCELRPGDLLALGDECLRVD